MNPRCMDALGAARKTRQGTKDGLGGNYSQGGEAESRRPHKPEIVGSNPTPASDVLPDRCGHAHQPVESRPEFRRVERYDQIAPAQAGF